MTETWSPSVDGVVTRLQATRDCLDRLGHPSLVIAPAPPRHVTRSGRPLAAGSGEPNSAESASSTAESAAELDRTADQVIRLPSTSLPFLAGGRPFGAPLPGRVRSAIEQFGADIVHVVNPFWMARAGNRAARVLGLPLVASFHQDLAMVAQHMHLGFLQQIIWGYTRRRYATADITLATSQAMLDLLAHHGVGEHRRSRHTGAGHHNGDQRAGRLALWPCGVDPDRFTPTRRSPEVRRRLAGPDEHRTIALYAGRLAPEKALDRLYPLAHDPDTVLVIAGDGPQRPVLERDLAGGSVRFTGWLTADELADAYAAADVFVFPSTTETLGFGLIEALAAGLPVIAADSAPTREILGASPAGKTVPAAAWDAEVIAAVRWFGGPGRAAASSQARQRAAGWDWDAATRGLVALYSQALNARRVKSS